MKTNALPDYDDSVNTTGCCPRFNPAGWDGQELHFDAKRFVRATTRSLMHIPLNMGEVFARTLSAIEAADAVDPHQFIVLSRDLSAFASEHLFAVTRDVPGQEMVALTGTFLTRVFEGPYSQAREWHQEMVDLAAKRGAIGKPVWFFYTTCPKCAKAYGKNYVVGLAQV